MDVATAQAVLGVGPSASEADLRAAYRRALRRTHPDLHTGGGEDVRAVVAAYRLLLAAGEEAPAVAPEHPAVTVDGDTVAAELPAGDLFAMLAEVGDRIGHVSYADPDAGLLEVIVDIAGHGTCSVVLTLQGRATGLTECWCTVEPLGGGAPPPANAVAELLADGLRSFVERA